MANAAPSALGYYRVKFPDGLLKIVVEHDVVVIAYLLKFDHSRFYTVFNNFRLLGAALAESFAKSGKS